MNTIKQTKFFIAMFSFLGMSQIAYSQNLFIENFEGTTIDANWTVVNPNPPSSASLTGNGELNISASTANGGSDYWPTINFNAPRLLTPVSGDWNLLVKMRFNPIAPYEGAGILILPDNTPDGTEGYRLFERFYDIPNGQTILNCGQFHDYTDTIMYIRIEKNDSTITGVFSADSLNWSDEDTVYIGETINYVGLHTIRKAYDGNMKDASAYFDYFHLTYNTNLSIDNIEHDFDFNLYPNPANNFVTISNIPTGSTLKVMDFTGKMVVTTTIHSQTETTLSTADFVNGMYFIHIENNGRTVNKKFIVQK